MVKINDNYSLRKQKYHFENKKFKLNIPKSFEIYKYSKFKEFYLLNMQLHTLYSPLFSVTKC